MLGSSPKLGASSRPSAIRTRVLFPQMDVEGPWAASVRGMGTHGGRSRPTGLL